MNNKLNIQIENVLNAYKNGNQEQKTMLENNSLTFGVTFYFNEKLG